MTQAQNRNDELLLRQYLLGGLAGEEQRALEQRLMTDQNFFNRLLRTEEELVDEYVQGQIPQGEKQAFESRFMQDPKRRSDVQFRAAIQRYLIKQGGEP